MQPSLLTRELPLVLPFRSIGALDLEVDGCSVGSLEESRGRAGGGFPVFPKPAVSLAATGSLRGTNSEHAAPIAAAAALATVGCRVPPSSVWPVLRCGRLAPWIAAQGGVAAGSVGLQCTSLT